MINEANLAVVNRGILGAVGGGVAIAVAAVVMLTMGFFPNPVQPTGDNGTIPPSIKKEVTLSLTSVNIKQIDDEAATVQIVFDVFNPNKNTMVLETIQYDLLANGIRLAQSQIGERLEGVVAPTGQTYYVVQNTPLQLTDTVEVKKTETFAPVWTGLQSNDVDWRIKGVYIITDPVRSGGQEKPFDFTL